MDPQRAVFFFAAAVGLASSACDTKKSEGTATPPLAASNVAAALGVDADLPPPPDPSPAAGDLARDVAEFTTVDACVAAHAAKLDPLVGDALLSFGYDTFLRDACRQVDAVKSRDPKKCDTVVASLLARNCRATVAMVAGKPDDCPFPIASTTEGRMRTCVAVASRDPRLCGAEAFDQRAMCEAIVTHDETKCDVVAKTEIAACRRVGQRLASSLPPAQSNLPTLPTPSAKLVVHSPEGAEPVTSNSASQLSDASEGVALTVSTVDTTFSFGPSHEEAAFPHEVTPTSPLRIGLDIRVPNVPTIDPKVWNVMLEIPGGLRLSDGQVRGTPKIKIVQLAKERGGVVEFTIDGELKAQQTLAFHLEVRTFVRDVIRPQ